MAKKVDLQFLYCVEDYITFRVKVVNGNYAGTTTFCVPRKELVKAVNALDSIMDKSEGQALILDYFKDDYLFFCGGKLQSVIVCGQLGSTQTDELLKFEFLSDQTLLGGVINALKNLTDQEEFAIA